MKTSVVLIGFMGTGKTAVGRVLAERLSKKFVDLDELIEKKSGKSITQIFRDGEIAFREMEIAIVKEISNGKNQIISTGGGVVLNQINIDRLKQDSFIVLLTASPSVMMKRTSVNNNRPLLVNRDRLHNIRELLKFRQPFYKRAADFTINTNRLTVEAIAGQIIDTLRHNESFDFKK